LGMFTEVETFIHGVWRNYRTRGKNIDYSLRCESTTTTLTLILS